MTEQIREHPRARAEIELARGVRMTQHVAAEVRASSPAAFACLTRIWRTADDALSGPNGIVMRTNTCLVGVFGGRPLRR